MKTTGVVRRIDDLGRIVIPKEIRKNFHITEGESIEIFISDDNTIALKKFSHIDNIKEISDIIASSINQINKKHIIIVDNNSVISEAGSKAKNISKKISSELIEILNLRKTVFEKNPTDIKIVDENIKSCYIIEPINVNGDIIGAIILLSEQINEIDNLLVDLSSKIITKYIEQ